MTGIDCGGIPAFPFLGLFTNRYTSRRYVQITVSMDNYAQRIMNLPPHTDRPATGDLTLGNLCVLTLYNAQCGTSF